MVWCTCLQHRVVAQHKGTRASTLRVAGQMASHHKSGLSVRPWEARANLWRQGQVASESRVVCVQTGVKSTTS